MKKFLVTLSIISFGSLACIQAAEKDVWYNAKGEAVIYTAKEKKKEVYISPWERREMERDARAAKRRAFGTTSSRRRYFTPYYAFPSNFTPSHYRYGYHYGYAPFGYYGRGFCSPRYYGTRFSASYRGNGWSVRLNY